MNHSTHWQLGYCWTPRAARRGEAARASPLHGNMAGSDLPTAKSSRSAHRSKHNEKTVIFPLFCNKSQTPSAFTCSPGFGRVIPTIPEVCDRKVPPNYSWCSSSLKWRNRRSWQWTQHSARRESCIRSEKWLTGCDNTTQAQSYFWVLFSLISSLLAV